MAKQRIFTTGEIDKFKDDLHQGVVRRKTAKRAIIFATRYIFYSEAFPAFIHCSSFFRNIGDVGRDPFPMWLKRNLFIEVDSTYIPGEKCKGWIVNKEFYVELRQMIETVEIADTIEETALRLGSKDLVKIYAEELNGEKAFEYSEGADGRFYNPLQSVKTQLKKSILFVDYNDYDISSAAPAILRQLYLRLCKNYGSDLNHYLKLPWINDYVDNKEEIRTNFALDHNLGSDIDDGKLIAKKILNSLFNKSRLAANGHCMVFSKYLDFNEERMRSMQQDPLIVNLKKEISFMWKKIEKGFNAEYELHKGTFPKKPKRWFYYFAEERKILNVIIEELNKITGNPMCGFFVEHDGFRIHKKYNFNIDVLERTIFEKTGYILNFVNKDNK